LEPKPNRVVAEIKGVGDIKFTSKFDVNKNHVYHFVGNPTVPFAAKVKTLKDI